MTEKFIQVKESEIERIQKELELIKNILLIRGISQESLEEEISQWETLSDQTLEDFENSL